MRNVSRGDVWVVDLGLAGKVRPCLLLTGFPADDELAMVTVLAHSTSVRGNPWELRLPKPFLKEGAFHCQLIHSVPIATLVRKLGELNDAEWNIVLDRIAHRLAI